MLPIRFIVTNNMRIDPELCKRLDRAVFSNREIPEQAKKKFDVMRAELLSLIASYNPEIAQFESGRGLYRLYTIAIRLMHESATGGQK